MSFWPNGIPFSTPEPSERKKTTVPLSNKNAVAPSVIRAVMDMR